MFAFTTTGQDENFGSEWPRCGDKERRPLFRAGDAGLTHDRTPADDLALRKILQPFDRGIFHRREAELDDLILDVALRQNGVELAVQSGSNGTWGAAGRDQHLPGRRLESRHTGFVDGRN